MGSKVITEGGGRKFAILVAAFIFTLGAAVMWASGAFKEPFYPLVVGRFIVGVGVGLASMVTPLYIGEVRCMLLCGVVVRVCIVYGVVVCPPCVHRMVVLLTPYTTPTVTHTGGSIAHSWTTGDAQQRLHHRWTVHCIGGRWKPGELRLPARLATHAGSLRCALGPAIHRHVVSD